METITNILKIYYIVLLIPILSYIFFYLYYHVSKIIKAILGILIFPLVL